MNCPRCGHDNIQGTDRCENCLEPFRDRDVPQATEGLQRQLMEEQAGSIATTQLFVVSPEATVADAVREMKTNGIGCVLVVAGDGSLSGIFTERDLMKLIGNDSDLGAFKVKEVMTSNPEAVDGADSLRFAIHKMSVGGFRHIPITQDGRAIGVVSAKDVVRLLAREVVSSP